MKRDALTDFSALMLYGLLWAAFLLCLVGVVGCEKLTPYEWRGIPAGAVCTSDTSRNGNDRLECIADGAYYVCVSDYHTRVNQCARVAVPRHITPEEPNHAE